jgi:hypothetical protein
MEGASETRSFLDYGKIIEFNGDPSKLEEALLRAGAANVLLHYAGRAYQDLGCPIWMPGVLSRWKRKFPNGQLTIFFHELPGKLPFFSRHFLLGKISQRIVRQLCAIAGTLVTNTEGHAVLLDELSGGREIHCLPIASNIQPLTIPDPRILTEFLIFGLPFGRFQTVKLFDAEIRQWQAIGRLTKLHLIGPEDQKFTIQANRLMEHWPNREAVVRHGLLPDAAVARIFARVGFALTNVTAQTWSKSSVFMACAATGCAPVLKTKGSKSTPLLHSISTDEVEQISETELASRRLSLKTWYYESADWDVTARRLASLSVTGALGS